MEDLYRILQTHPTASSTELKKCYQELALLYHPDKSKAKDKAASSEKFIAVNRAYKILSDPDLRTQYDVKWKERCLAQTFPIQETVDFEEFEEMVAENESNDVTENLVKICDVTTLPSRVQLHVTNSTIPCTAASNLLYHPVYNC